MSWVNAMVFKMAFKTCFRAHTGSWMYLEFNVKWVFATISQLNCQVPLVPLLYQMNRSA